MVIFRVLFALLVLTGGAWAQDVSTALVQRVPSQYSAAPLFGTGADGNVTISSGTTTLTRDMHYAALTLSGTGALNPNGFRVFVSGTLDLSAAGAGAIIIGTLSSNNAAGATGGAVVGFYGYYASTPHVNNNSGIGSTASLSVGTPGATAGGVTGFVAGSAPGGAGGSGTNAGGAASASVAITATQYFPTPTVNLSYSGNQGVLASSTAGNGGSSGGGDGTNTGGGGGSGATSPPAIAIYARFIQRGANATAAIIQLKGGVGGNGGTPSAGNTGGGGGGGGGSGGFVYVVAEQFLGSTIANAIDVSGGTGGNGGNGLGTGKGGAGGSGGNSGNVQIINLSAPSFTVSSFNQPGTAGGTTATSTGATGGAGATLQVGL